MRGLKVTIAFVGLALMTACGGASSAGSQSETITASPGTGSGLSSLRPALLTEDDLPSGFSAYEDEDDEQNSFCGQIVPQTGRKATASFADPEDERIVQERISDYDTSSSAESTFDAAVSRLQGCTEYSDPDGTRLSLSALSLPSLGDRSFAIHLTARSDDSTADADADAVYVLREQYVLSVAVISRPGNSDSDLLSSIASKAYQKLSDVADTA